jgi:hypothetical protein
VKENLISLTRKKDKKIDSSSSSFSFSFMTFLQIHFFAYAFLFAILFAASFHLQNRKTAASALQDRQPRQPIISSCQP